MNPRVSKVIPLQNWKLLLTFSNGEDKIFDVKPWLEKGIYQQLKNIDLFKKPFVAFGTVVWNEDIDFSPDTLYMESYVDETLLEKI